MYMEGIVSTLFLTRGSLEPLEVAPEGFEECCAPYSPSDLEGFHEGCEVRWRAWRAAQHTIVWWGGVGYDKTRIAFHGMA